VTKRIGAEGSLEPLVKVQQLGRLWKNDFFISLTAVKIRKFVRMDRSHPDLPLLQLAPVDRGGPAADHELRRAALFRGQDRIDQEVDVVGREQMRLVLRQVLAHAGTLACGTGQVAAGFPEPAQSEFVESGVVGVAAVFGFMRGVAACARARGHADVLDGEVGHRRLR